MADAENCPHCQTVVVFEEPLESQPVVLHAEDHETGDVDHHTLLVQRCPFCRELVIHLVFWQVTPQPYEPDDYRQRERRLLSPRWPPSRQQIFSRFIPAELSKLFNDAVLVEPISTRGACALLRTCLEALLIHQKHTGTLEQMIDAVLDIKAWPSTLIAKLHLVRLLGNWGAHWSIDKDGKVIDIDAAELEAMFSAVAQSLRVVYVEPQQAASDIKRLNAKLEQVGKQVRVGPSGELTDAAGGPWPPLKRSKSDPSP